MYHIVSKDSALKCPIYATFHATRSSITDSVFVDPSNADAKRDSSTPMSTPSRINAKIADTVGRMSANERRLLGGLVLVLLAVAPIKAAS